MTRIKLLAKTSALAFFLLFISPFNSFASAFSFDEDEFLTEMLFNKVSRLPKSKRPQIALVLGGGGARGFAHIGVLRVLQEEQVPVDLVVGTSIGAVVGAFYCSGVSLEKLENMAKKIKWKSISNVNVPSVLSLLVSENLLSNEKIEEFFSANIGDMRFEDLMTPLVCVATDLNTGERVLLREGNVAFAARASSVLPGVFKPVEYKQRFLVDGGLSENIPVGVAKLFDPDVVVAVDVSADITKNSTNNVFGVLMQAIYIQGMVLSSENLKKADFVISPDVSGVFVTELEKADSIIDKGFIAGEKSVSALKRKIINKTSEKYLIE